MTISSGEKLPDANLQTWGANGPEPRSTADVFGGRKVALFAVPGAFTPTCSAQHMPGFVAQADALRAKGIDAIACISVNDVFVMGAWAKDQNAGDAVEVLADGDGAFTKAIGMAVDTGPFGGLRSLRYSMVVDDGVVTRVNLEEGGAYEVSSAEHMLGQL